MLRSLHLFIVGRSAALGSCCCSPSSLSSLGTSSSSDKDLAKHIVDLSMADVRFPAAESARWGGRRKKGGTGQLRASSAALSLHKRGNSGNASLRDSSKGLLCTSCAH